MSFWPSTNGAGNGMLAYGLGLRPKRRVPSAPPSFDTGYTWINGDLVPDEDAAGHLLSPALHFRPDVFAGIRCYSTLRGPGVFRLDGHLQRFLQAVKVLGVSDFRWTIADLRRAVAATIQANSFQDCYIRPVLYFGGRIGLDPDSYEPHLAVAAWEWDSRIGTSNQQGVRMMVASFAEIHPNTHITKGGPNAQFVNTILARSAARRAGFDEAILLDADGFVAECTGENLFVVRDGVIYTPPRTSAREGITRDTIITLARDLGYHVVEERLSRAHLDSAGEIFMGSTAAEVVPVGEVDSRTLGDGQSGPVTRAIQQLYFDTVRGRGVRSPGWVEYVMMEPLY